MENINNQRGDVVINYRFFNTIIKEFEAKNIRNCLDLGSGTTFNVEQVINRSCPEVYFHCVDIQSKPKECPSYVSYFCKSIEMEMEVTKKYDAIMAFECIEHVDKTDMLLRNAYNNLKDDGLFFVTAPNLASLYSRIELLFGYQPHILEVSNESGVLGTGWGGKMNCGQNLFMPLI